MSGEELEARARQEYVLIKWQILQEQRRQVCMSSGMQVLVADVGMMG
jgi:hypothetical protein